MIGKKSKFSQFSVETQKRDFFFSFQSFSFHPFVYFGVSYLYDNNGKQKQKTNDSINSPHIIRVLYI